MRPLLIVKTGSALPRTLARRGDFHQWIAAGAGRELGRFRVVSVCEGEPLPEPDSVAGVLVTGSPAMVSDLPPWATRTAQWLADAVAAETPVFGICYGHQLLALALGGRVDRNPRGREMGTVEVTLLSGAEADPLFAGAPRRLRVHCTHVESILELPAGARRLAENDSDPNHAFAFGPWAWGVQFHPEFDADIMRGYLDERREVLEAEGFDLDHVIRDTQECPESTGLLRRFADLVEARDAREVGATRSRIASRSPR